MTYKIEPRIGDNLLLRPFKGGRRLKYHLGGKMMRIQSYYTDKFICSAPMSRFNTEEKKQIQKGAGIVAEKSYQCKFCPKRFAQSSNLRTHIRIHTKEKPYQCKYCQKIFTQSSNLKVHIRIHTKEKPYQCKHCKKYFTLKGNLTVHIRIHTNEKPYQCALCQQGFSNKSSLTRHNKACT